MSTSPSAQQGGSTLPSAAQGQQQGQSTPAKPQQQQGSAPVIRDWASI